MSDLNDIPVLDGEEMQAQEAIDQSLLSIRETERHNEIIDHAVLTFKQQWEQDRIQKRAKKKAKKALIDKGYEPGAASKLVKAASQTVLNKPTKRSTGRGR